MKSARARDAHSFQVLLLLEPEVVSGAAASAARRDPPFDLALGHDGAAVAAAGARRSAFAAGAGHFRRARRARRTRPSAFRFFAHGGTWVPEATWARPPRPKRREASLICGDKALTRGHALRRALWLAAEGAAKGKRVLRRYASAAATTLPRDASTRVLAAAPEAKAMAVAPYAYHARSAGVL